jgi:hypothetical protein
LPEGLADCTVRWSIRRKGGDVLCLSLLRLSSGWKIAASAAVQQPAALYDGSTRAFEKSVSRVTVTGRRQPTRASPVHRWHRELVPIS